MNPVAQTDNFEHVIDEIRELKCLYDSIVDDDKKVVMNRMFSKHIEGFIHKMEESYYKKIIQKKTMTQLKTCQEIEIERSYNTMQAFLPFVIAHSISQPPKQGVMEDTPTGDTQL
jgi:hypothetical protein